MFKAVVAVSFAAALVGLWHELAFAADLPVYQTEVAVREWRDPPPRLAPRAAPPLPYYRDESVTIINNYNSVHTPPRWYPPRVYRDGTIWDGGPTSLPYSNQSREFTIRRDERLRCDPRDGCSAW